MTFASESGHWYDAAGRPAYEVAARNGSMRPTTLRDARKLNLAPSVSGIIKCAAADALANWKIDQAIMSALTLPRIDGEETEEFAKRIKRDSKEQARKAAELGSFIHGCIEKDLCGQPYDHTYSPHVDGALKSLAKWCGGLHDCGSEKSFCHPLGYGGKCDVHKPGFLADFKSKDFTEDNLPLAYDNHAMQLAAYREGFALFRARCAIVYVSTRVPGLTHLVEVGQDDLAQGWEMFKALLAYWQAKNRYSPQRSMENVA